MDQSQSEILDPGFFLLPISSVMETVPSFVVLWTSVLVCLPSE